MTRFFLERPVTLTMVMLACLLFGVLTLFNLELTLAPDMGKPGLTILVRYPGTSSDKIQNLITKKVEEGISRVPGISQIKSISSQGKSKVHVIYPYGTNLDLATMDILDALAPVGALFPRDVEKPVVLRYDPSDSPIFTIAISGKNLAAFRRFAEKTLKPKFERIKGVSEVIVEGGKLKEVLISVDRYKASSRNTSLLSVVKGVQFENSEVPGGIIPGISRDLLTKTAGRYKKLKDIYSVRIAGKDKPVFLSDIADVSRQGKPLENKSLSRGKEQVAVYVKKGGKASLISVATRLNDVFESTKLPQGASARVIYDASIFLKNAINRLVEAGIFAALIASLVLFIFLRKFSTTAVISLSIPLSIAVTFAMIGILKIPLDIMTISGLAVGAGMIVDNSVVVLESIHSSINENKDYKKASYLGAKRVGIAVFASTLTTACVFLPVLFLSPRMKLLFGKLASAITISLFASLFIALTAVPVFSYLLLKRGENESLSLKISGFFDSIKNKMSNISSRISSIFYRTLRGTINKPILPIIILCILIVGAVIIMPLLGQEILSPLNTKTIFAYVEFRPGTNLKHTTKTTLIVSKIIRKYPFVKRTDSRIDKAHSVITIKLKKENNDLSSDEALDVLTKRFKKFKNAFVHLSGSTAQSGGGTRSVTIDVTGNDLNLIKKWAKKGASIVGRIPGIREVVLLFKDGNPELLVNVNKVKASLLGLTSRDIGLEVRSAIFGPIATKFIEKNKEVDVRVRFKDGDKIKPAYLPELPISLSQDKTVPLKSLASFSRGRGGGRIYRKNGKLTASFSARFNKIDLKTAIDRILSGLRTLSVAKGIRFHPGDEAAELKKSSMAGIFAVIIAILLVFMVLASLYESFTLPFVVILSIPVAISTALIALFIGGISLSVPVYLGLIMLAGLVVNNAILIIDDAKKLSIEGLIIKEAALQAVKRRIRPLMITTLTTVLGMFPLLLSSGEGASLYRPLAMTVLIGLSFATLFSLYLVPSLFAFLYKKTSQF